MTNKFKLLLAIIYALGLGALLYYVFRNFDFSQINNYAYIKENSLFLVEYKSKHFVLFTLLFFILNESPIFFRSSFRLGDEDAKIIFKFSIVKNY